MSDELHAVPLARGTDLAAAASHDTAEGRAVRALLDALMMTVPEPRRAS